MKIIKYSIFIFLISFFSGCAQSPNRSKAEGSVTKYMEKFEKYLPINFGELFEQTSPERIEKKLNTKGKIKYSVVHTYSINGEKVINDYFHLDKNYIVMGKLSNEEMDGVLMEMFSGNAKFDSITKSIEGKMLKDSMK